MFSSRFINSLGTMVLAGLLLAGCSEDITPYAPGEGHTASVSFYGISQTFPLYGKVNNQYGDVGIFMDTVPYVVSSIVDELPVFSLWGSYGSLGGINLAYPVYNGDNSNVVYLDYFSGTHAVTFSYRVAPAASAAVNTPAASLLDTSVYLPEGSHSILYFTDAPAAEGAKAAYRSILVDEPLSGGVDSGKVGIRIVHLSADAGTARVALLKPDGTEANTGLPQSLDFAYYSDYIRLDTANARYGQLVLHIYPAGSTSPVVAGIPAAPGHSYEVLLNGLAAPHSRQVVSGYTNGQAQYQAVVLPASLGATVRQTY